MLKFKRKIIEINLIKLILFKEIEIIEKITKYNKVN